MTLFLCLMSFMAMGVGPGTSTAPTRGASTAGVQDGGYQPQYPLAAALVLNGELFVVDLPSRTLTPFRLPGFTPEEADLTLDKQKIVVAVRPTGGGFSRLLLISTATGAVQSLDTGDGGEPRQPRFADNGDSVVFSSPLQPGRDSKANHDRVRKVHLSSLAVEDIAAQPSRCNLEPVSLGAQRVAYISTSCFIDFELMELEGQDPPRSVARLSSANSELASSPDHEKLVYTQREGAGDTLYLLKAGEAPRRLAKIRADKTDFIQPRFVCPRDVLVVEKRWREGVQEAKVLVVNSDTGEVHGFDDLETTTKSPNGGTQ